MDRRTNAAEAGTLIRSNTAGEWMANSEMTLYQESKEIAERPASLWPGGDGADGPDAVPVAGHIITLVADGRYIDTFRLGTVTLLISDTDIRITAEVRRAEELLEASLRKANVHPGMDPEMAAQVFRAFARPCEAQDITVRRHVPPAGCSPPGGTEQ